MVGAGNSGGNRDQKVVATATETAFVVAAVATAAMAAMAAMATAAVATAAMASSAVAATTGGSNDSDGRGHR